MMVDKPSKIIIIHLIFSVRNVYIYSEDDSTTEWSSFSVKTHFLKPGNSIFFYSSSYNSEKILVSDSSCIQECRTKSGVVINKDRNESNSNHNPPVIWKQSIAGNSCLAELFGHHLPDYVWPEPE